MKARKPADAFFFSISVAAISQLCVATAARGARTTCSLCQASKTVVKDENKKLPGQLAPNPVSLGKESRQE